MEDTRAFVEVEGDDPDFFYLRCVDCSNIIKIRRDKFGFGYMTCHACRNHGLVQL